MHRYKLAGVPQVELLAPSFQPVVFTTAPARSSPNFSRCGYTAIFAMLNHIKSVPLRPH